MILLSGPYGHPDIKIKEWRAIRMAEICLEYYKRGIVAMSPLIYGLGLMKVSGQQLPDDYSKRDQFCRDLVLPCTELYVVNLEGWDTSKGVADEIKVAKEQDIPCFLVDADTLEIIREL